MIDDRLREELWGSMQKHCLTDEWDACHYILTGTFCHVFKQPHTFLFCQHFGIPSSPVSFSDFHYLLTKASSVIIMRLSIQSNLTWLCQTQMSQENKIYST